MFTFINFNRIPFFTEVSIQGFSAKQRLFIFIICTSIFNTIHNQLILDCVDNLRSLIHIWQWIVLKTIQIVDWLQNCDDCLASQTCFILQESNDIWQFVHTTRCCTNTAFARFTSLYTGLTHLNHPLLVKVGPLASLNGINSVKWFISFCSKFD